MKIIKSDGYKEINSNTCGRLVELCNNPGVPISITKAINLKPTTEHAHKKSTEIYWLLSGTLEMVVEKENIKLNEGDIIVMSPGEFHKVTKASEENVVVVLSTPPWSPTDEFIK
ncbi:cupin domain-containing protein [candidate division WWE3 bacterium]|jgi:mannose-6-phosphate isomerase-like protein (cupin superfamily)|nr:cupin domain-containing protein [candidate division WWE3 bacterium]MBT7349325.1 cupin domain-containing protein [candidate division WWE3 bacterium]